MALSRAEVKAIASAAASRAKHHTVGARDSLKAATGGAAIRMVQSKILPPSLKGGFTEVIALALAGHFMRKKWNTAGAGALGVVGALAFDNFMSGGLNNLFGGGNAQGLSYAVPLSNQLGGGAYEQAVQQAALLVEGADAGALYGAGSERAYDVQQTRAPHGARKINTL